MHGLEIKNLSIEALASLRDEVSKLLGEKVAGKQRELEAEITRLSGLASKSGAAGSKAKPKYRKGSDEWSGRGSQPGWVKAHLEAGGTLEELRA
jgi:DNA-binding protein H-NS